MKQSVVCKIVNLSNCTGINDLFLVQQQLFFDNNTNVLYTKQLTNNDDVVKIYNLNGVLIQQFTNNKKFNNFDLSAITNGVYFAASYSAASNKISRLKFVKEN